MDQKNKIDEWKGIPREEIKWSPKIDEKKCTGCGMCITSCGRNVFDFDKKKNKSIVAKPMQCMVGCTSCEVWCVFNAITFPDKQYVKDLIKRKGVLEIAKKQLDVKLENKSVVEGKNED
ncbi:MAG: 4Fe-4S dicluster domain-containing protein [Candidatus Pacearchaeota archaeon]